MEIIPVELGERSYPIYLGEGEALPEKFARGRAILLTDSQVVQKCLPKLRRFLGKVPVIQIPAGERHKNLSTVTKVYRRLVQLKADRQTFVCLLGGGVVGDLGGYVAATYLRGIPYAQIPTSLTAQVDSSIGGKVGVDLPEGKNLIGAFYQPRFVFSDVSFLKTLPTRELLCGLGEVVKYGIISDPELFEKLGSQSDKILKKDPAALYEVVRASARIKAAIVSQDEQEISGVRRTLNFGHTFGHALERLTRYRRFSHGEAVAIGMVIAARLSHRFGHGSESIVQEITRRLTDLGLPTTPPSFPRSRWLSAIQVDKKSEGGKIRFVFVKEIGQTTIQPVDPRELVEAL